MNLTAEIWSLARDAYAIERAKMIGTRAGKTIDNAARIRLASLVEYRNQLITRACREALL